MLLLFAFPQSLVVQVSLGMKKKDKSAKPSHEPRFCLLGKAVQAWRVVDVVLTTLTAISGDKLPLWD